LFDHQYAKIEKLKAKIKAKTDDVDWIK